MDTTSTSAQAKRAGGAGEAARAVARLGPQTHEEALAVWNAIAAHVANLEDVEGDDAKTDSELAVLRGVMERFDGYVARVSL